MPYNCVTPLQELYNILTALPGMQKVNKGIPVNFPDRVSSYLMLGGITNKDVAFKTKERRITYFIGLVYRVTSENEDVAEEVIGGLIDHLQEAISIDPTLGATVKSCYMDTSDADHPDYRVWAKQEYRVYPIRVLATQHSTAEL